MPVIHETKPSVTRYPFRKTAGFLYLCFAGFLMHYVYSFSGNNVAVACIAPVNESVWEHLKLGYTSLGLYALAEYGFMRKRSDNYFTALLAGILALESSILIIHYMWVFITGKGNVIIDIASYFTGSYVCQQIRYVIMRSDPLTGSMHKLSFLMFILIGVALGILTFSPPKIDIFLDYNSNSYGIPVDPK